MYSTTEITSHQITSDNPIHQRLVRAYVEASKIISGSILEIGCGVGRSLQLLLENCNQYTAIDKNKSLLDSIGKKYPNLHLISQNIPPLTDIPDESFDYILSFQVIEHVKNDELFIKEVKRVLKPNGKFIVSTPNRIKSITRNPWHIREYTATEFEKLIGKYFNNIEAYGIQGSEKALQYYEENRKAVEKILRFDVLNLHYRLPRQLLQIPYDILNRFNRKSLQKQSNALVQQINEEDYFLSDDAHNSLDLFFVVTK